MVKKTIFFDKDKCIGCCACIIACKMKHNFPPHPTLPPQGEPTGINLINVYHFGPAFTEDRVIQFFQPISCMHCLDAPCINVCPTNAIYTDSETGAVLVNQKRCIGCKVCIWACPYGALHLDSKGRMEKCDMCIDRIRKGKPTACEAICVARAIFVGTPEEVSQIQAKKAMAKIKDESPG
jgi:Fe-S-cluster-containing dehydrogenase component